MIEESDKFKVLEQNTDHLYVHVSELEMPIEEQLQTNMALNKKYQALCQKGDMLDDKIKSGAFKFYDQQNHVNTVIKKKGEGKKLNQTDQSILKTINDDSDNEFSRTFQKSQNTVGGEVLNMDALKSRLTQDLSQQMAKPSLKKEKSKKKSKYGDDDDFSNMIWN